MIIDAQVHIWSEDTPNRPWYDPAGTLPSPFGYEDLRQQMAMAGVDAAVLVPPDWAGGRPELALEGTRKYPTCFSVMGRIDLTDPANAAQLADWTARPGMLGLRLAFQKEHQKAWLDDGTADWFWPEAEKHGLPLMLFAPGRHRRIAEIARAHPRLRIIIDHMGLNREQDTAAAAGIEALIPLAGLDNVAVKVTSLPLYSTEPYPHRNLHQPLARLIAAFGPERAFWGTDLTRIWYLIESYRHCVTLFTEELDFLSGDDLDWVMGRGVARWIGWPIV